MIDNFKAQNRSVSGDNPKRGATVGAQKPWFINLADINFNHCSKIDWLIEDITEAGTLVSVFGDSGEGKSFVKIDMALSISTGIPWNGHKTQKGCVLYVAAEGIGGLARRVKAWLLHKGLTAHNTFALTQSARLLTAETASCIIAAGREMEEVTGYPVRLVVFDTLMRHIDGDDSNPKDMQKFITLADTIRNEFNCVVSIVAHPGLSDKTRVRGAGNFHQSLDSQICIIDRRMTCLKMKEGALFDPIDYRLEVVSIGTDSKGDSVDSCIPIYGTREAKKKSMLNDKEVHAVKALKNLLADDPHNTGVPIDLWRQEFKRLRLKVDSDAKQNTISQSFTRIRQDSLKKCGIEIVDDIAYFTDSKKLPYLKNNSDRDSRDSRDTSPIVTVTDRIQTVTTISPPLKGDNVTGMNYDNDDDDLKSKAAFAKVCIGSKDSLSALAALRRNYFKEAETIPYKPLA